MKKNLSITVRIDYTLLFSFIALTVLGILSIYSAESPFRSVRGGENQYIKQIYWAVSGIVIFILLLFVHYQKMGKYAMGIYILCIVLLLVTLFTGKEVRGAKSWLMLPGGFGFQTSEFVKIGVIFAIARFLERTGEEIKRLKNLVFAMLIAGLPMILILFQPDFGTALVYLPIVLVMLYFGGVKYSHLISLLIIFGIAAILPLLTTYVKLTHTDTHSIFTVLEEGKVVFIIAIIFGILSLITFLIHRLTRKDIIYKACIIFLIFFSGLLLSALLNQSLKTYQKERLVVFLKPSIDPFGTGYNIIQSKIAVGAGGLFGKGFLGGTQSQLGFLPERSTDFIFAIFAEAWGFMGCLFLLALYGLFIFRILMILYNSRDSFSTLVTAGILGMFLFHIIVNIGMTIGIMPITGIPLPFLSYGGSFLITCMISVSILFNIELRRYAH